jgi:predicted cupin superfamily sugar epimerase
MTKQEIIKQLGMIPLDGEGGFFKQTHLSEVLIETQLKNGKTIKRPSCTSILYLIGGDDFSALHRLEINEFFHFVAGAPCELTQITEQGEIVKTKLGSALEERVKTQEIVFAGNYQGLRSLGEWTLLGTYMSPGFSFEDFEIPSRIELFKTFPNLRNEILSLTRGEV